MSRARPWLFPWLFLAVFSCLLGICHAHAGARPPATVQVGFYEFPPAIFTGTDGTAQGPLADVIRQVFIQAGYPLQLRSLPSARLYTGLQDGSVQVWAGAPGKPQLEGHTDIGKVQIAEITLNLYRLPDTPAPELPQGLAGRKLIMINGYTYWPGINEMLDDPQLAIEKHRTSTHEAALGMLLRRRGDFLLDYEVPIDQISQQLGVAVPPFQTLQRLPIHFILSRHMPNSRKLLDALDKAYLELQAAGVDLRTE